MRAFRFSPSRSRLEIYEFGFTPGTRIATLPAWARFAAVIYRNAVDLVGLALARKFRAGDERGEWRREIVQAIAVSVDYVHEAGVPGDIAEFGTMTGTTAYVMARTARHYDVRHRVFSPSGERRYSPKKLQLFDSFEGLPESTAAPDLISHDVQSGTWGRGRCVGLTASELSAVCGRFLPADRIRMHEGWFKDTLPRVPDDTRFALVHIDSDLYQSAKEVLDQLFRRGLVSDGAAFCFDDWNPNRANPAAGERRAWEEAVREYDVSFSDWGNYGWAGKRFIVHSYHALDRK